MAHTLILLLVLSSLLLSAVAAEVPETWLISPDVLVRNAKRLSEGDAELGLPLKRLREEAEAALKQQALSVTNNKLTPPSGDSHDYFSFGIYWWPNPATPDGLPYIRQDGQTNPAAREGTDLGAFTKINRAVATLGLAYYFTQHEPYAAKATELTRAWYLDPATRMNPNMNHAQAIPGKSEGRSVGLIDAAPLSEFLDGIALIRSSFAWNDADEAALRVWLEDFYGWLRTSKNGREQEKAPNNLGVYYDVLATHLALFLGKTDEAKARLREVRSRRIDPQIAPDGRQPHELARSTSLSYSIFSLEAYLRLAALGNRAGCGLWEHRGPEGQSIKAALDLIAPYVEADKAWELGKQIKPANRDPIFPLIKQAFTYSHDATYAGLLERFGTRQLAARWRLDQ